MLGTLPHLMGAPYLILTTAQWAHYYCYPQFTKKKWRIQVTIPKFTTYQYWAFYYSTTNLTHIQVNSNICLDLNHCCCFLIIIIISDFFGFKTKICFEEQRTEIQTKRQELNRFLEKDRRWPHLELVSWGPVIWNEM